MTGRLVARAALAVGAVAMLAAACSASGGEPSAAPSTSASTTTTTEPPSTTTTTPAPPTSTAGCHASEITPPGVTDVTMPSGGVDRVFQLQVPPSYDGTEPYPLVFDLHALTVNYTFVAPLAGLDPANSSYRFILVAPSGRLDGSTPYWFAAPTDDNYDVAFIGDLLDRLEAQLCVDPSRVFFTGISNGAQMSSLLACRMSDRITAIAPVSGVEFLEPCDGDPVPVLAFHGSADPILPYTGGGLNATAIANAYYWKGNIPPGMPEPLGVDESMRRWAEHNGCTADFVEEPVTASVRKRTWPGCAADTVLYVVDGGGHCWPGKPVPAFEASFGPCTTEIDATTLMLAFFFDDRAPG